MAAQPQATAEFLKWADTQSGAFDDMEEARTLAVEMLKKKLQDEGYLTEGPHKQVEATELAQKLHDAGLEWHGDGRSWREGRWSEQGWQWSQSAWGAEPSAGAEEWQEHGTSSWTASSASDSREKAWYREANNKREAQDIVDELRSREIDSLALADLPDNVLNTAVKMALHPTQIDWNDPMVIAVEKLLIFQCSRPKKMRKTLKALSLLLCGTGIRR